MDLWIFFLKEEPWTGSTCDRTTSEGVRRPRSAWAILSEARTQSTHRSTISYIEVQNRSYYNLGSRFSYIEEGWSQNYASEDKSEFAEVISLNGQNILFALKENAIHRRSKPEDPSTESYPHRFGLPTDNLHRHRRQEKAVPHLHTVDNKSKAWATTLSKTYPRWPKDHP
jgi:hypothetical protein